MGLLLCLCVDQVAGDGELLGFPGLAGAGRLHKGVHVPERTV